MGVTREQVEYCFQQATQGKRFSQAYCVDRLLELFAALAEKPQAKENTMEDWSEYDARTRTTEEKLPDLLKQKEITVANHIRQAANDGCQCEPCIAAREVAEKPAERPQLSAEQPSGVTYGKEVSECLCGTETQWLHNGVPTCWDCLGDKPAPAAPPVVQADELDALAAEFHWVYQREARRQGNVRHPDEYKDLPEYVKEYDRVLAKFVLERDAAIRREAERAAFEKAAQIVEQCPAAQNPYYASNGVREAIAKLRALADSPVSGEKP